MRNHVHPSDLYTWHLPSHHTLASNANKQKNWKQIKQLQTQLRYFLLRSSKYAAPPRKPFSLKLKFTLFPIQIAVRLTHNSEAWIKKQRHFQIRTSFCQKFDTNGQMGNIVWPFSRAFFWGKKVSVLCTHILEQFKFNNPLFWPVSLNHPSFKFNNPLWYFHLLSKWVGLVESTLEKSCVRA